MLYGQALIWRAGRHLPTDEMERPLRSRCVGSGRVLGTTFKEILMPIILWLLGVPLSVVLLLFLFGVF